MKTIYCHRLKRVNKKFPPSSIYDLNCALCPVGCQHCVIVSLSKKKLVNRLMSCSRFSKTTNIPAKSVKEIRNRFAFLFRDFLLKDKFMLAIPLK